MKKRLVIQLFIFLIFNSSVLISCSIKKDTPDDYKFGIVYTSLANDETTVATYDANGNNIYDKNIDVGGITLASFLKFGISNNNNIYYACPISGNKAQSYILQIDKNNLEFKKITSEDYITPTFFCVDNDFAYLGSSTIDTTYISKTHLSNDNVVESTEFEGQGVFSIEDKDKLYVISIIHSEEEESSSYGKVYILNKSDLSVSNIITLPSVSFVTDAKIINNDMYILINRDGKDNLSNKLVKLDLNNKSVNTVELPFNNLFKLLNNNNYIYIIESSYHQDETSNKVARINLSDMKIDTFNTENQHISSYINENKYISSDGKYIYLYNLDNFNLINKFPIKEIKDQNFVSFYLNN